jgi:hypothetical protein
VITRFDHAVIAVQKLDIAIAQYEALGFEVSLGGKHTGRGTRNAIVRFGPDYLELLEVLDRSMARDSNAHGPELVDFLERGHSGLVGFGMASDDLDDEARGLKANGIAVEGPYAMERRRPDGKVLTWRLVVPNGRPWFQYWPFLIQWDLLEQSAQEGRRIDHPNGAIGVTATRIHARDLSEAARFYQDGLRLAPVRKEMSDNELAFASIDGGIVEVVPGPDPKGSESSVGIFEVVIGVRDLEFFRSVSPIGRIGESRWQLPLDRTCGAQITLELIDS